MILLSTSVCLNRTSVSLEWLRLLAGSFYTGVHSSSTQVNKSFQPATCKIGQDKIQTADRVQNADRRLQIEYKMQTGFKMQIDKKNFFF